MKRYILTLLLIISSFILKSQDIVMFNVTKSSTLNKITWVTENQENNDVIILQKKLNNIWINIEIISCNQTNTPTMYTIIDNIDSKEYRIFKINVKNDFIFSYIII